MERVREEAAAPAADSVPMEARGAWDVAGGGIADLVRSRDYATGVAGSARGCAGSAASVAGITGTVETGGLGGVALGVSMASWLLSRRMVGGRGCCRAGTPISYERRLWMRWALLDGVDRVDLAWRLTLCGSMAKAVPGRRLYCSLPWPSASDTPARTSWLLT